MGNPTNADGTCRWVEDIAFASSMTGEWIAVLVRQWRSIGDIRRRPHRSGTSGLARATTRPLQDLGSWHDTALNWDYPPDPGPWRQDECEQFRTTLECILEKVPGELGADNELVDEPSDTTKTPISTGTLPVQALTWLVGEGSRDRRRPSGPDHQGLGP